MKPDTTAELLGEIREGLKALDRIRGFYLENADAFADEAARDQRDAIVLAEVLCSTFTCLETLFLRISQAFENNLPAERWHKELLHKMCIEIPGVRKAVLSPATFALLDELRRFRHFKRYYYQFEYDWSRLDYLRDVYDRAMPQVTDQLNTYITFLETLKR